MRTDTRKLEERIADRAARLDAHSCWATTSATHCGG